MTKLLAILCMFVLSLTSSLIAQSEILSQEKVYLNTEQLFIDDTGMFVEIEGKVQPLAALFRDAKGLYVTRAQLEEGYTAYECPAGHPSAHGDGRCNQPNCPYFRGTRK